MNLDFASIHYQGAEATTIWVGLSLNDTPQLNRFLTEQVSERLHDRSGRAEYQQYLEGLALTGMGQTALQSILEAETHADEGWMAGEALAEAVLIEGHGVVFPWNMERDKRNHKASLQGADIIGLLPDRNGFRLAFGEVKSSEENRFPPTVMKSLGDQIISLTSNLIQIQQLLYWLHQRIKNSSHESAYRSATTRYLNSSNKDAALYGVLIRDTSPNELDLKARAAILGTNVASPGSCHLLALYLPLRLADLPGRIGGAN